MIKLKSELIKYKNIIFDYNGTLLYDTDWCVDCLSLLMFDAGLKPLTLEEYRERFYFPVEDFYKEIGFDFSKTSFADLGQKYHQLYLSRPDKMHLYEGAESLIQELLSLNKKIAILTALKETLLYDQLDRFGIRNLFHFAYGLGNIHAKSKIDRGFQLIKDSGFQPKETVIVGDTTHDAEVAHHLGCDAILLADGHQSHDKLLKFKEKNHQVKLVIDLKRSWLKPHLK